MNKNTAIITNNLPKFSTRHLVERNSIYFLSSSHKKNNYNLTTVKGKRFYTVIIDSNVIYSGYIENLINILKFQLDDNSLNVIKL